MSAFSGSLVSKRKGQLVQIADALGVSDASSKNMNTLREDIQNKLESDADTLKQDPQFEGLYRSSRARRQHTDDSDSPQPDKTPASRARRSIGKALDRLNEASQIPLPDSPVPAKMMHRAAEAAEDVVEVAKEVADDALALVDTDTTTLVRTLREVSGEVAKYLGPAIQHGESHWRNARDIISQPGNLLIAAIALEGAVMYYHVAPFHRVTVGFPPRYTEPGSFASFFENAFQWAPTFAWTFAFPRFSLLWPSSDVWPAFTWWIGTTVLPPLALSTLISFVPQKGVNNRRSATTRYQTANPPSPTVDALTFAIFRLAILLVGLSSAAPWSFAHSLELSGDPQLRVIGAGVLVALVLAQRLTAA